MSFNNPSFYPGLSHCAIPELVWLYVNSLEFISIGSVSLSFFLIDSNIYSISLFPQGGDGDLEAGRAQGGGGGSLVRKSAE